MSEIAKNYNAERINRQKIEDYLNKKNGLWSLVFKVVRLTAKNHNEIEDIASESLFQIWEKAGTFKDFVDLNNKGFRTWVGVITENKARLAGRKISRFREKHILYSDYFRKENNCTRDGENPFLEELAVSEETPVSLIIQSEEKKVLETALTELIPKLSYKLKTAIEMHYFENYSQSEIAKRLNIPFGTVQSRLYRARKSLKKRLKSIHQY